MATADALKAEGTAALKARNYPLALEKYTAALTAAEAAGSPTAVLLSNRAAVHQALGSYADALADADRALAA